MSESVAEEGVEAEPERPEGAFGKDGDPAEGRDAVAIAWSILSSPRTLVLLLIALAALAFAGALVPQGADREALLQAYPYAMARALQGLGLSRVATAWPTMLVALLLLLNVAGLSVRLGFLEPGGAAALPGAFRGSRWLALTGAEAAARASEVLRSRPKVRGGATVVATGLFVEGLALVAVGALTLIAGALVADRAALDARVTLVAGAAPDDAVPPRSTTRVGDAWVEKELPVTVACGEADPADPTRRRACVVATGQGSTRVDVVAGRQSEALGVVLRPLRERPIPGAGPPALLLRRGGEVPEVLRGEEGRTYALPDGTRLTSWTGPDGPLVVAERQGERTRLLAPDLGAPGAPLSPDLEVRGVPAWEVDLGLRTEPERPLLLAAAALLVLGLLSIALLPQVSVVLVPSEEGTLVRVTSVNRAAAPERVLAALSTGGAPTPREGSR